MLAMKLWWLVGLMCGRGARARAREPSLFSQAEAPSLLICYGK